MSSAAERAVAPAGARSVTFLTRALTIGGAERQLVVQAIGLSRRGHRVVVASFYDGPLADELRETGVRLLSLKKRHRWDVVGFLLRLAAFLRAERPDALYGFLVVPNILAAVMKGASPRTRIVWGVRASNMDFKRYDWLTRLTFRLSCALSRRADSIIANSESGRAFHARHGYPADRMTVIPNGIDVERFAPDPRSRASLREEWGFDADAIVIGIVGRLDVMKGHDLFLRAFARVAATDARVHAVVVGEGPDAYRNELRALVTELGLDDRVRWARPLPEAQRIYSALDILCSASRFGEGFSNVVAEAMACGVPCVVTDCGDSRTIVGDLGEVVPVEDADAIASALARAIGARGPELSRGCRSRIVDQFAIDRLLNRTEEALWA